jgi:hypothetical protein
MSKTSFHRAVERGTGTDEVYIRERSAEHRSSKSHERKNGEGTHNDKYDVEDSKVKVRVL